MDSSLDPDTVVHVCTSIEHHEPWVRRAIEAGCHVVVEKPLAPSLETTRRLLDLAERHGRLLVPVHQFRFQRGTRALIRRVPSLDTIHAIDCSIFTAGAEGRSSTDRGEVLMEMLPHPLSLLHELWCRRPDGGPPPAEAWSIEFGSRSSLRLWVRHQEVDCRIELHLDRRPTRAELVVDGSRGRARADLFHGFSTLVAGRPSRRRKLALPLLEAATTSTAALTNLGSRVLRGQTAYPGLLELLAAFYATRGPETPVGREEILYVAEVMDRVRHVLPS